jgi:hypothetical protein
MVLTVLKRMMSLNIKKDERRQYMGLKKRERLNSILVMWFIFICPSFTVSAQQEKDKTIEDLSRRVRILERQKEDLKEHINDKLKIAEDDFKNKSTSLNTEFLKFKAEMEHDYNYMEILVWIFGPIIVITVVISYLKLLKRAEQFAEEKIKKKFDSLLEDKESRIIDIIKRHDKELQLKKHNNILVLTPAGSDDSSMKKFFKKMEFKEPDFQSPGDLPNLKKYHLVLFNNEQEKFEEGIIPNLVRKSKGILFFYFGPPTKDSREIQNEKNVAFANYGAQLYGNLINSLRFQALLKKE